MSGSRLIQPLVAEMENNEKENINHLLQGCKLVKSVVLVVIVVVTLIVAGNLLSSFMTSFDDEISDDGASDEQRIAETSNISNVELD